MNLPNFLTLSRIFLVPIVVAVLLTKGIPNRTFWGASLFLVTALTDLLDGYLARRRKQVTTLGRLLDPIADKLLISSALISLVWLQMVPAWMVVIIIGREFAVSGMRSIAAHEGFSINVSTLGKGKMVTQVAAIVGIILGHKYHGWVAATATVLLWAVVILALVSMIQYFREFWSKLDNSIKYREKRRQKVREQRTRLAAERRELRRLRKLETVRKQEKELDPTCPADTEQPAPCTLQER